MPPKKKTPAPIDRPLSRAYLREFTGWSSAYPPGISDPTSLRIMENVQINRDGSARIRPGLRYVSFDVLAGELIGAQKDLVGTHEPFFLNDGSKAYLFAVREDDLTVGFRALAQGALGLTIRTLDEEGLDFRIEQGTEVLNFTEATTYVKYLQIDNKIYALSNAGETMRQFTVGEDKSAKVLQSIDRPNWDTEDKLVVVHPDAAWINAGVPIGTVTNRIEAPDMSRLTAWTEVGRTRLTRSTTLAQEGVYSGRLASTPERTNLMPHPLNDPATTGVGGWTAAGVASGIEVVGDKVRVNVGANKKGDKARASSEKMPVTPGEQWRTAFDLEALDNIDGFSVRYTFYTTSGAVVGDPVDDTVGIVTIPDRKVTDSVKVPKGATKMRIFLTGDVSSNTSASFRFKNVLVSPPSEPTTMMHGDSGTDHFWTGDPDESSSVYHPPATVQVYTTVRKLSVTDWKTLIYFRSGSTARDVEVDIEWRKSDNTVIDTEPGTLTPDDPSSWTRIKTEGTAPAKTNRARVKVKIHDVPRGEFHYMDSALFVRSTSPDDYFDGNTTATGTFRYDWTGEAHNSTSQRKEYSVVASLPPAETKTADTLISSDKSKNQFNFGFFYTFSNEVGESAPSRITIVRTQRAWPTWYWETPNVAGEPSGTDTSDPELCADQLVAYMPQPVFEEALDSGATHWNLFMLTWSDQDAVPVMAMRVDRQQLKSDSLHARRGWLRATVDMAANAREQAMVPAAAERRNYSDPSSGAQGIVASDRMVLVNDPQAAAVIRWTSNQQGYYTDFSSMRGGGYKTLTSGNLFIPACVKLWQNPQSVDTLTILCMGVDGYSTGYYMQPAQVASQSESTNIMGFEETTATPGTVSPYGCEVMNNALYHPLDEQLMKSTATNYNINHKSMTDAIDDVWKALADKHLIVSSQHDTRLYYLVYNPEGEELAEGCRGNEVWVFDTAAENGHWSRWMTQGLSLRRLEQGGQTYMSLVRPDGIYYFDPLYDRDDTVDPDTKALSTQFIPWKLETNTQGANRAHDAWAHLQQANVTLGNFLGQMRYGVRGLDENGKRVNKSKIVRDQGEASTLQWDLETFLLVQRNLREWFFYAESVTDDAGVVQRSTGQVNLVQYRYTPVSVNVGYEYGSVETFEYGRAGQPESNRTTDNGVPMPYVDTARP